MDETPNTRLPASIFFFLAVLGAFRAYSYASQMPAVIASHFGGSGAVNGWQSKSTFFTTELAVVALASFMAFALPRLLSVVPVSLINVPNKEYWFAPERRENALAFFRVQFAWFGCALLAFLLFVNELVFRANLTWPHKLNSTAFGTALVVFLAFVLLWTIRMLGHFSKSIPTSSEKSKR
jgi:uncharacterized membrane protein